MNNTAEGDDNTTSNPYNFLLDALSETMTSSSFLSSQTKESFVGFPKEPDASPPIPQTFQNQSLSKWPNTFSTEYAPNVEEKTTGADNNQIDTARLFSRVSDVSGSESYSSTFGDSSRERIELQALSYFSSSQNVEQLKQAHAYEDAASVDGSPEQIVNNTELKVRQESHSDVYAFSTTELDSSLLDLLEKIETLSERSAYNIFLSIVFNFDLKLFSHSNLSNNIQYYCIFFSLFFFCSSIKATTVRKYSSSKSTIRG